MKKISINWWKNLARSLLLWNVAQCSCFVVKMNFFLSKFFIKRKAAKSRQGHIKQPDGIQKANKFCLSFRNGCWMKFLNPNLSVIEVKAKLFLPLEPICKGKGPHNALGGPRGSWGQWHFLWWFLIEIINTKLERI